MKVLLLIVVLFVARISWADNAPSYDSKNNIQPTLSNPVTIDNKPVGMLIIGATILAVGGNLNPHIAPAGAYYIFGGAALGIGILTVKW